MRKIIEMVQILQRMNTDTYLQCKYALQAVSRDQDKVEEFVNRLFNLTDRRRPLLIGMKKTV